MVVEPASIPRNSLPLAFLISFLLIVSLACLSLNTLYSSASAKSGATCLVSDNAAASACSILSIISLKSSSSYLDAFKAAPMATKYLESSGKMISSSLSCRVSMNRFLSSDRNDRGPPRNAIFPLMVCPQARPLIV